MDGNISVEATLLKNLLEVNFKNIVCKSYNQNKIEWNFVTDMTALNEDDLIESLVVHSYDADLLETHSRRSFKSTKLIDFLPQNLKNTNRVVSDFLPPPIAQNHMITYICLLFTNL